MVLVRVLLLLELLLVEVVVMLPLLEWLLVVVLVRVLLLLELLLVEVVVMLPLLEWLLVMVLVSDATGRSSRLSMVSFATTSGTTDASSVSSLRPKLRANYHRQTMRG